MGEGVPHILAKLLDDRKVVAAEIVHQEGKIASQLEHSGMGRVSSGHDVRHVGVRQAGNRVPVPCIEEEDDAGGGEGGDVGLVSCQGGERP